MFFIAAIATVALSYVYYIIIYIFTFTLREYIWPITNKSLISTI